MDMDFEVRSPSRTVQNVKNMSSHSTMASKEKNTSPNIIKRIFSRGIKLHKGGDAPEEIAEQILKKGEDPEKDRSFSYHSSPFVRPLEGDRKLKSRFDFNLPENGEAECKSPESGRYLHNSYGVMAENHKDQLEEVQHQKFDLDLLKTQSQIVEAAIPCVHPICRKEWALYLQDYCEGRFNIMSPPKPPMMHPNFTFLPALHPSNEMGRLTSLKKVSPVWTPWQESRGKSLVQAAQDEFGASGVSISLIDSNLEILKVEKGYNRRFIKRPESIAAHVLLSTEVLVVLDTQKDWRFAGNPLVIHEPRIRFFAGAPMLSPSGDVLGVFAIFGREPRDTFTVTQRRDLTDYSVASFNDLTTVHELSQTSTRRTYHTISKASSLEVDVQLQAPPDFDDPEIERELVRARFPYSTDPEFNWQQHTTSPLDLRVDTKNIGTSSWSEYTPPYSDQENSPVPHNTGFWKNHKNLVIRVGQSDFNDNEDDRSSGPSMFRQFTPRPFSGSDLTSVDDNPHPNTPEEWEFRNAMLSCSKTRDIIEHIASLDSSAFQFRAPGTSVSDPAKRAPSPEAWSEGNSCHMTNTQKEFLAMHRAANRNHGSGSTQTQDSCLSPLFTISTASTVATHTSFSSQMSDLHFAQTEIRAKLDFAAKSAAHALKFDRVYAVELTHTKSFPTKDELTNDGMSMRILGSYNCPEDTKLDIGIHKHVIRCKGGAIKWQDADALPGAPTKGFLMRLTSNSPQGLPRRYHTEGIVYGAFRTAPLEAGESAEITDEEQIRLIETAKAMKKTLLKKLVMREDTIRDGQPSVHDNTNTRPVGFPANEAHAVDIDGLSSEGISSLDSAWKAVEEELKLTWDREQ